MRKFGGVVLVFCMIVSLSLPVGAQSADVSTAMLPTYTSGMPVVNVPCRHVIDLRDDATLRAMAASSYSFEFAIPAIAPELVFPSDIEFQVYEGQDLVVTTHVFHWSPISNDVEFGLWNLDNNHLYCLQTFTESNDSAVNQFTLSNAVGGRYLLYVINRGPGSLDSGFIRYSLGG